MPIDLGASVAIIQAGQILLIQREDFEVWGLPGGQVEAGESVAQAAMREAREETGLEVELTRLVGMYSLPNWANGGSHNVLFAATPTGGTLQAQVGEVIDVRYFDAHALPEPLIWWHRQRILDALHGVGGSVAWRQNVTWPFDAQTTRENIYQRRDQAGLPRQELYFRFFGQHDVEDETLEVGGAEIPPT